MKKQAEIVKQRLEYHFRGTDGSWIYPNNLPFMKEFLNEVDMLCTDVANGVDKSTESCHIQNVNKSVCDCKVKEPCTFTEHGKIVEKCVNCAKPIANVC